MKAIFSVLLVLFTMNSIQSAEIIERLMNSDALETFWYGDDGESCLEPIVTLLSMDSKEQNLVVSIEMEGNKIGCYETMYRCLVSYKEVKGDLVFDKVEPSEHCLPE